MTPFAQRMRDLVENGAETAVSMIRQAGAPYEGDIALNQDNLTSVGLIQLYETLLSKAESMSLQMEINDADANKQLQLAVARLADLYNLLGDEAFSDALNPTIGFGSAFNSDQSLSSLDYGALSSALFCFDNQVPTLLDEELALLRGRSAANAPSTKLSPYYNRLVWNFTRGITAGEVAYAVNYDISGTRSEDKSFDFVVKASPVAVSVLEAAKVAKGSKEPNRSKVGSITWDAVRAIAENKMKDLNCFTIESAMSMVAGTARSMGVKITGESPLK